MTTKVQSSAISAVAERAAMTAKAKEFLKTEMGAHFFMTPSVTKEGFSLAVRESFGFRGVRVPAYSYVEFDKGGEVTTILSPLNHTLFTSVPSKES